MGANLQAAVILCMVVLCARAKTLDVNEHVSKIAESNIELSISMYKTLVAEEKSDNVMFSPISISVAMAMLHLGAKGDTATQIDEAFMFSKIEEGKFHSAFGELNGIMFDKVSDNVTIKSSNRVFSDKTLKVLSDYENALTVYGAQVDKVDFSQSALATTAVNEWVTSATNNAIPSLLEEGSLDGDTKMIVANAVYFRGDWLWKFNEKVTEKRPFYITHHKMVETTFMFQRSKFRYAYIPELTLQLLELPYAGEEYSMIILIPENFNLLAVEKNLNYENLTTWISNLKLTSVDVTLPKFKLEQTLQLENILPKLGVVDIFDESKSNLGGISESTRLQVDQIVHKVAVEIDEKGSTAAAVSAARLAARSIDFREHFFADHPFLWMIRDAKNGLILFLGRFQLPDGPIVDRKREEL